MMYVLIVMYNVVSYNVLSIFCVWNVVSMCACSYTYNVASITIYVRISFTVNTIPQRI